MYERTLHSAVRHLATVPHHTVPMKELWLSVTREAEAAAIEKCSLADFAALLDADSRFDILGNGFDPGDSSLDDAPAEVRELSDLGFCPTCSVRLRVMRDGEDGEEMPSIVHKHLSETKRHPVRTQKVSSKTSATTARPKRGSVAVKRPTRKGGKRRAH